MNIFNKFFKQLFCQHNWETRTDWPVTVRVMSNDRAKKCAKCQKAWMDPHLRGIPMTLSSQIGEFWEIMYWDRKILHLNLKDTYQLWKTVSAYILKEKSNPDS